MIELAIRAGLNGRHVAFLLDKQAGSDAASSHWRKLSDGSYALHLKASPEIKSAA